MWIKQIGRIQFLGSLELMNIRRELRTRSMAMRKQKIIAVKYGTLAQA